MRLEKDAPEKRLPGGIKLIHEDDDILVVDKPAGLLTIGTETERTRTAYFILSHYVRGRFGRGRARLFIVHRLDRDTSGLLVFAKNEAAKRRLQDRWEAAEKKYWAVVHGRLKEKTGALTSLLAENRARRVYSTRDAAIGKWSRTEYRVLKENDRFSLLEIRLVTGRKNQIRVHLADIGHPVVGDRKYGDAKDPHKRLALHAFLLSFPHPSSGERLAFETPVPSFLRPYQESSR